MRPPRCTRSDARVLTDVRPHADLGSVPNRRVAADRGRRMDSRVRED